MTESFESDGNGVRYTIFGGFSDNVGDYFLRTDGTNTVDGHQKPSSLPAYSDQDGSFYFAGEDTENGDNPNTPTSGIIFNDIDISGYGSLQIQGLFAAGGKAAFDPADYMHLYTDIDNSGSWTLAGAFEADISSGSNSANFGLDTNLDGQGEDETLKTSFQSYTFNISESGTSLDVKIELYLSAGDEEAAFDLIKVLGTLSGGVNNPLSFSASSLGANTINLEWTKNADSNNVVIAKNTDTTFGSPVSGTAYSLNANLSGGGIIIYNGTGSFYNHTSLNAGTTYYYKAWSVNGSSNYSSGVTTNATTALTEPTHFPKDFLATLSNLNVILSWADTVTESGEQAPQGYLIKASSMENITAPVDGVTMAEDTDLSDGSGSKYITQGKSNYTFTNLAENSTYYFKIYPYTNSGAGINYKTDGTVPKVTAVTDRRAAELFFSEYIEGSSYNKALEIFNPTGASVDLSNYRVRSASGGGGWNSQFRLDGILGERGIFVIGHSRSADAINNVADTSLGSGVVSFNGDDARQLEKTTDGGISWIPVDVIGDPDNDPGSGWTVAGESNSTQNRTLVRKSTVSAGNLNWTRSAGTSPSESEWILFDQDTFSHLGSHTWTLITVTESGGQTQVYESGITDTYTLTPVIQPTADVTITISVDSQVSINPSVLIFTSSNWTDPQEITVSAQDDALIEGNHTGLITHSFSSEDGYYNAYSMEDISVNVSDNDIAGITIVETDDSTVVIEGGTADTYTLVLNTQPTADVTVTFSVSSNGEVTVSSETAIFTNSNWNIVQTVTITAVDDQDVETNEFLILTHTANSVDDNYNGISIATLTITVVDNDTYNVPINEIMYNSSASDEEWIELYNGEANSLILDNNWILTNSSPSWSYTFDGSKTISANGYFTIQIGSSGSFPFTPDLIISSEANKLVNKSSTLTLAWSSRTIDMVTYSDSSPWPTKADGNGPSLELKSVSLDNSVGYNWQPSYVDGGTPGAANSTDIQAPTFSSTTLSPDNNYIDLSFSESVFSTREESGALEIADFNLHLSGGLASEPGITSIAQTDSSVLNGGEVLYRIFLTYKGTADGSETLSINPADSTSIFDAAGNAAAASQSNNTVVLNDQLIPELASSRPADDAVDVAVDTDIILTFNENIIAGTGNVMLLQSENDSLIQNFAVTSSVTINENEAKLNSVSLLDVGTEYYILIDSLAFMDNSGNSFNGISDKTALNFSTTAVLSNTAPVITSNGGRDSASVSVEENQTVIATITASDGDGNELTFSLTDGTDKAQFSIDAHTGELTFLSAPDYEHPTDADANNVYIVYITVTDDGAGNLTDTQVMSVTVTDVNEKGPTLISSIPEDNATEVNVGINIILIFSEKIEAGTGNMTLKFSADDSVVEVFDIVSAMTIVSDSALVNPTENLDYNTGYYLLIDSGAIRDTSRNDFPGISEKTGLNFLTAVAANSAPVITSNGGSDTARVNVFENQIVVITVTATDADNNTLAFSLSGGADKSQLQIMTNTGALTFKSVPDFENPVDSDSNNTYIVEVSVTDNGPGNLTDSQVIMVNVMDVDENPLGISISSTNGDDGSATNQAPISILVRFSDKVSFLNEDSIAIVNGSITSGSFAFSANTDSASFSIAPQNEGLIKINIPAGAARDSAGNEFTSAQFTITYDVTPPTVILTSDQAPLTNLSPFSIKIEFSEAIYKFEIDDSFGMSGGTIKNFEAVSSVQYSLEVIPEGDGTYWFFIPAEACQDAAGNLNTAGDSLMINYDSTPPVFENGTPSLEYVNKEGFGIRVESNENGKVYYSILEGDTNSLSPDQIKTGEIRNSIVQGESEVLAYTSAILSVNGLKMGSSYDVFSIIEDAAGNVSPLISILKINSLWTGENLFFSEYIEGKFDNKALEIYNPSAAHIRLEPYRIARSVNGGGWQYYHTFPDSAILKSRKTWVILNSGTEDSLFSADSAQEVLTSLSIVDFDGNDALGLVLISIKITGSDTTRDSIFLDIVGTPDRDPGRGWNVAGISEATKNHTLIRKIHIRKGNTNWTSSAGKHKYDSEWIVYGRDTFRRLGRHEQTDSGAGMYLYSLNTDTLIYDYSVEPFIPFPELVLYGGPVDSLLTGGKLLLINYRNREDSLVYSKTDSITARSKTTEGDTLLVQFAGRGSIDDYIGILSTLEYFHRETEITERKIEFQIKLIKDTINCPPLSRVLILHQNPLAVNDDWMTPDRYLLYQNYPNPFNSDTHILYEIPNFCEVTLKIYNLKGEKVRTLVKTRAPAGRYLVRWDGRNDRGGKVTSGMYFYRLSATSNDQPGKFVDTRKLLLLK